MNLLHSVTRPYYLYRPGQILKRVAWEWRKDSDGQRWITLPWGHRLLVNSTDDIGQALGTTGVNDLVVTETIFRLLDQGGIAVDVGANIGYMTSAMSACVGPHGHVISFEPHPDLQRELRNHISEWEHSGAIARDVIQPFEQAVSDTDGEVILVEPAAFQRNRGRSQLANASGNTLPDALTQASGKEHRVTAIRLDTALTDYEQIAVVKIDVEGHEARVLHGASQLLESGRIRDLIFEEFDSYPAETHAILEGFGTASLSLRRNLGVPAFIPHLPTGSDRDMCHPTTWPPVTQSDCVPGSLRVGGIR